MKMDTNEIVGLAGGGALGGLATAVAASKGPFVMSRPLNSVVVGVGAIAAGFLSAWAAKRAGAENFGRGLFAGFAGSGAMALLNAILAPNLPITSPISGPRYGFYGAGGTLAGFYDNPDDGLLGVGGYFNESNYGNLGFYDESAYGGLGRSPRRMRRVRNMDAARLAHSTRNVGAPRRVRRAISVDRAIPVDG